MSSCIKKIFNAIQDFFKNWEKTIVCISAIVVIFALFLTLYQVREAKNNLQANMNYQIHKEGRSIISSIRKEKNLYSYFVNNDPNKNYDSEIKLKAEGVINEIINFYASIYQLRTYEVIDDKTWKICLRDFCGLFSRKPFNDYWKERVQKGSYDEGFKELKEKCK